jgi:hypothetical protein
MSYYTGVRETPMHLQIYGKNKSGETLWIKCGRLNFPNNIPKTAVEWAAESRKTATVEITTENYYHG